MILLHQLWPVIVNYLSNSALTDLHDLHGFPASFLKQNTLTFHDDDLWHGEPCIRDVHYSTLNALCNQITHFYWSKYNIT